MKPALPRATLREAAEAALITLAMSGDAAAFGELVRRRQCAVRTLLRRLSRDPALAEDLAQQTFLTAWRMLRQLRALEAFGGWLRTLAINCWLQHLRRVHVRNPMEERWDEAATVAEPAHHETFGERLDLLAALARLAPPVRLCVVLAYSEGMSHGEISQATGLPLGTVKSHIQRGAARLRESLQAYQSRTETADAP